MINIKLNLGIDMVLYNTDDTPPAASGFPVGTIYIQYTA